MLCLTPRLTIEISGDSRIFQRESKGFLSFPALTLSSAHSFLSLSLSLTLFDLSLCFVSLSPSCEYANDLFPLRFTLCLVEVCFIVTHSQRTLKQTSGTYTNKNRSRNLRQGCCVFQLLLNILERAKFINNLYDCLIGEVIFFTSLFIL